MQSFAPGQTPPPDATAAMGRYRARVLLRWRHRVCDDVARLAGLSEAVLLGEMPELHDYLLLSAADPDGSGRTNAARAHGANRAWLLHYRACDLLREFQLLRQCVHEIAQEDGAGHAPPEQVALAAVVDAAACEALDEFERVRMREQEVALQTLAMQVREHVNTAAMAAQRIVCTTSLARIATLSSLIDTRLRRIDGLFDGEAREQAAPERLHLLLSTFDIVALAREAALAVGHPDCTVVGDPVTVTWCRVSMKQALRNLLAAGPEAQPPQGITVRQAYGRVILSVQYAAVLTPHFIRTLFAAGEQDGHPTIRTWGKGLSFVREVAESHGGSALVHSLDGTGTLLTLDVPHDASPFVPAAARADHYPGH